MKLSMDKVLLTVADHGNTSAASIPLALDAGSSDLQDARIAPRAAFGSPYAETSVSGTGEASEAGAAKQ